MRPQVGDDVRAAGLVGVLLTPLAGVLSRLQCRVRRRPLVAGLFQCGLRRGQPRYEVF